MMWMFFLHAFDASANYYLTWPLAFSRYVGTNVNCVTYIQLRLAIIVTRTNVTSKQY
jgi:hypothetical protein